MAEVGVAAREVLAGEKWKVDESEVNSGGRRWTKASGLGVVGDSMPEAEQWVAEIETSGALSKDEWTRM